MSTPSPILNVLNKYLSGSYFASQKAELFGILRDAARSIARGEISFEEFSELLKKIANSIAIHRQLAGLSTNVTQLMKDLESAIKTEVEMFQLSAIREEYSRLRRRRRRRGEESTEFF